MKVCIIGKGNVGTHLCRAFEKAGVEVGHVGIRELGVQSAASVLWGDADVFILAVRDSQILEAASDVAEAAGMFSRVGQRRVIAHTSGSVGLDVLRRSVPENRWVCGVIYPLQTFSKHVDMDYSCVPFLVEGENEETASKLAGLAGKISDNVIEGDSEVRGEYHLGGVIACNFSNYLFMLADEYLKSKDLDFKMLLPLIRQTIDKLEKTSPQEAQTGPAARGDIGVIKRHKEKLNDYPEISDIYNKITSRILGRYQSGSQN